MFSDPIEIRDARIESVKHKPKDGQIETQIWVHGAMSPELAETLGCHDNIYDQNDEPRAGLTSGDIDAECKSFAGRFAIDKIAEIEISGSGANNFSVDSKADDELRITFRLQLHGDPLAVVEYLKHVCDGESLCTITPLQQDLIRSAEKKGRKKKSEQPSESEPAATTQPAPEAAADPGGAGNKPNLELVKDAFKKKAKVN